MHDRTIVLFDQGLSQRGGEEGEPQVGSFHRDPKTGEMAHPLRKLAALPEDCGFIPSTHVVAHNHLLTV